MESNDKTKPCCDPRESVAAIEVLREPEDDRAKNDTPLPQVLVPGGNVRVTDAAEKLGRLMAETRRYYRRGRGLTTLKHDGDDIPILEFVKPDRFVSAAEEVAELVRRKGEDETVPTILNQQIAKTILSAEPFQENLPPIHAVTRCPVLVKRDGHLKQVVGYDRESGIYAAGKRVPTVDMQEARASLARLIDDFQFPTPGDRSRALAAIISPALVLGALLKARAPVLLIEANDSQTGKGYFVRLIAAVYSDVPATVTQTKKGVGGLEESFDAKVIEGRPFISLDNLRGKFSSPKLESFATEAQYLARVPYSAPIQVDPSKTFMMVTSNKAEFTVDFANRVSTVRLLKQPQGHEFAQYPEGDLLEHILANAPQYLAAVFAVVQEWFSAGCLRGRVDHDFRAWCGILDWIVTTVLDETPLMEGHREVQRRTTTPNLNWLRDTALALNRHKMLDVWLRPNRFPDVLEAESVEVPGLRDDENIEDEGIRMKVFRAIGFRLKKCFGNAEKLEIDGYEMEHRVTNTPEDNYREKSEYRFRCHHPPKSPRSDPEVNPEEKRRDPRNPEGESNTDNELFDSSDMGLSVYKSIDIPSGVFGGSGETDAACLSPASSTTGEVETYEF